MYRVHHRWSDRIEELEEPYFPGYIFCRFDPRNRLPILTTPGVQSVLGIGKSERPGAGSGFRDRRPANGCELRLPGRGLAVSECRADCEDRRRLTERSRAASEAACLRCQRLHDFFTTFLGLLQLCSAIIRLYEYC